MNSEKTKLIARTALFLALAIASQFLKNLSVYITGPIINCILIIATLSCGLWSGAVLSVITPVTAFLITGSPIMAAMPLVIVGVMLGNFTICLLVWLFTRKEDSLKNEIIGCAAGSLLKGGVMAAVIVGFVLNVFGPGSGLPAKALTVARTTFSVTQLITAGIGSVLAILVWIPLKKAIKK